MRRSEALEFERRMVKVLERLVGESADLVTKHAIQYSARCEADWVFPHEEDRPQAVIVDVDRGTGDVHVAFERAFLERMDLAKQQSTADGGPDYGRATREIEGEDGGDS